MLEYRLDTYLVDKSNRSAYTAIEKVAAGEAGLLMAVYGNSGVGKTHLLYACKAAVNELQPEKNVLYLMGDSFMNELLEHIRDSSMEAYLQGLAERVDLLLLDDLDFILDRPATLKLFARVCHTLTEKGKSVLFSTVRRPAGFRRVYSKLYGAGVELIHIKDSGREARRMMAEKLASSYQMTLSQGETEEIARRCQSIPEIIGRMKTLKAKQDFLE